MLKGSRQGMGPKSQPDPVAAARGQEQQPQQQPRQQISQALPPSRVQVVKMPQAPGSVCSNSSADDDVPLGFVDQKYLSDKKFTDFTIDASSKR